jgi:biotin carboxyl carrier protein
MRTIRAVAALALVAAILTTAAFLTHDRWRPWFAAAPGESKEEPHDHDHGEATSVKLGLQARENLGLTTRPVHLQTYVRTIQVPGVIVDRPGRTDRGITAPATAVVMKVHAMPGNTVRPGDKLFTLRLVSEAIQSSQAELFRATREAELNQELLVRMKEIAKTGVMPDIKLFEQANLGKRLAVAIRAARQDLQARGLTPAQIDAAAEGRFVTQIDVLTPVPPDADRRLVSEQSQDAPAFELQELKVELGQQVQAGQTLCLLANHQDLYIEGHAFASEAAAVARAAEERRPVEVELPEQDGWPGVPKTFTIRHMANMMADGSRTFPFYVPLSNQSRTYERDGKTFLVWRFRPGQRVRLHVPVEEMKNVFVLPAAAVVRDGPEAYAFRENGDLFDRRSVTVLYEDRRHVVVKPGSGLTPGVAVAQTGAAALLRVLKAQAGGGDHDHHHHH